MTNKIIFCISFVSTALFSALFGQTGASAPLDVKMEKVWNDSKSVFYAPSTNLFYTKKVNAIPSPADIAQLKPLKKNGKTNWHGGGSGTEDCSMLCGIMLAGLCDKYAVLHDDETVARARAMFAGLKLAATVHGDAGFIARGVSPADCKSIYPGSSRDQYTHSIHGMWRYYHSPMSTEADKADIKKIFSAVADKMTREVKPDILPAYSFKFYKGMDDDRGVGKMREVYPHEAARLAMFYAAAWDVSRNPEYKKMWRKYLPEALDGSAAFSKGFKKYYKSYVPAYSVLQMQASIEVLYSLEKNAKTKKRIGDIMDDIAAFTETYPHFDVEKKGVRDAAEIINSQLISPNYKLSESHEKKLRECVAKINGSWNSGGAYSLLSCYWRARLKGYLSQ